MGRKPTVNLNLPQRMRARKRGAKVYYYYDCGGRPRKEEPLGTDFLLACQKWAELERGRGAPSPVAPTFKDAADKYRADVLPEKGAKTQRDYGYNLDRLVAYFNDPPAPLDLIRPKHWAAYAKGRPKIAATRERAVFNAVWQYARELGYTDEPTPTEGWKGKKSERLYMLEDDVLAALRKHGDEPLRDAIDLAYLIGQRVSDVLRVSQTDIRNGQLGVRQGKTSELLWIALTGKLGALVEKLKARSASSKVHTLALLTDLKGAAMTYGKLRGRFETAREKAAAEAEQAGQMDLAQRIRQAQYRDTRSKAATTKNEAEGLNAASEQLGHRHVSTTAIYIRKRAGRKVTPTE